MPKIAYTVAATFQNATVAEEWLAWLEGGHLADVCAGGATEARAVKLDVEPGGPTVLEARYVFPSREIFDAYVENHAPALREEGLQKFPPERGVTYSRSVGEVRVELAPAG